MFFKDSSHVSLKSLMISQKFVLDEIDLVNSKYYTKKYKNYFGLIACLVHYAYLRFKLIPYILNKLV